MRTSDGGATWAGQYSREGGQWRRLDHYRAGCHHQLRHSLRSVRHEARSSLPTPTSDCFAARMAGLRGRVPPMASRGNGGTQLTGSCSIRRCKGRMWSVNSYTHDLPRPKMWRHTSPLNYKGGVCRSDDGGKTWTKSNTAWRRPAPRTSCSIPTSPVECARAVCGRVWPRSLQKLRRRPHLDSEEQRHYADRSRLPGGWREVRTALSMC